MYVYEETDDGTPPPKPPRRPSKVKKSCIAHFATHTNVKPSWNEMFLKRTHIKIIVHKRGKRDDIIISFHEEKPSRRPARPASR
jgi:hypothetical protein